MLPQLIRNSRSTGRTASLRRAPEGAPGDEPRVGAIPAAPPVRATRPKAMDLTERGHGDSHRRVHSNIVGFWGKLRDCSIITESVPHTTCSHLVKEADGLGSTFSLGVALHVQGDTALDVCLGADSVNGFLHLPMASVAPLHGIGRGGQVLLCEALRSTRANRPGTSALSRGSGRRASGGPCRSP